ncbi:MAG: ankyrin repeat domain-containing protein [Planctomycetaceae bacterium]|nr:ankyrin repeat domain-containing protein [Planctomycetaceae bacterium]
MKILPLSDICADQKTDTAEQRAQMLELLAAGAEIDATDKNGVTALHHAVRFRSPSGGVALLES